MGLPCSTAACYQRYATTDEYEEDAIWYTTRGTHVDTETFLLQQLGKFRYEVNSLSMMVQPYERCRTKAIYLYMDGVRIMAARAVYNAAKIKYLVLQYRSVYWRDHYHDTMEVVPKGRRASMQKYFDEHYLWYQSGEGGYTMWPFTMYRAKKEIKDEDREFISQGYEISI